MQIEGITGEYDGTPVQRWIEIEGQPILLECGQELWIVLESVAAKQGLSLGEICGDLLKVRHPDDSFAEAARIYVIACSLEQNLGILPPALRQQIESLFKYGVN